MQDLSECRSCLFVPASRPERYGKAFDSGADTVVIDLEDAVPAAEKELARRGLSARLASLPSFALRINAAGAPWFEDDLALCAHPCVHTVVLPKAQSAADLAHVASRLEGVRMAPIIETALGFDSLRQIARAEGVCRLIFGALDLQLELGLSGDHASLLYFRSRIVLESRLAGLPAPLDAAAPDIRDVERLRGDARHAKSIGFGGKLCIHPLQVGPVNAEFSEDAQVHWAMRVLSGAEAVGGAAFALDGQMIDRPLIERARRILIRRGAPS